MLGIEYEVHHTWNSGAKLCRGKKNFVFWFGAQFNSTLNFTQSGWPILFSPDLHFRPANWISCQTLSLWLDNTVQCRRHTGHSLIAIATLFSWTTPPSADISLQLKNSNSMDTWGNLSNLWIPCKESQLNIN